MAKKDDSPPLSLFSFQDIITTLTGIMFLIVLMLVLILLETKETRVDKNKIKSGIEADAIALKGLKKKADNLEKHLAESKTRNKETKKIIEALLQVPLDNINERLMDTNKKKSAMESQCETLNSTTERLINETEKIKHETPVLKEKLNNLTEKIVSVENELDVQKEAKDDLEKKIEKKRKCISFNISHDFPKILIIVECSKDGIRVKNTKSGETRDFRENVDPTYSTTVSRFIEWAKTRPKAEEYFTVIIKPSTFSCGSRVLDELLRIQVDYGLEIAPDDTLTFFNEE